MIGKNDKQYNESGFTLIELMVVVLIVGILASIAMTSYLSMAGQSQITEGFTQAQPLKSQVIEYYRNNAGFPADMDTITTADPGEFKTQLVSTVEYVNTGSPKIVVEYTQDAHESIAGRKLALAPRPNQGNTVVRWECYLNQSMYQAGDPLPGSCLRPSSADYYDNSSTIVDPDQDAKGAIKLN